MAYDLEERTAAFAEEIILQLSVNLSGQGQALEQIMLRRMAHLQRETSIIRSISAKKNQLRLNTGSGYWVKQLMNH